MNNHLNQVFNDSYIEKTFLNYLKDDNITVISFDIFDTLAFRDVSSPSQIFYKMGCEPYINDIFLNSHTFKELRVKAENKARKKIKYEEITISEIYEQFDLSDKQRKKIEELEIFYEDKSLFINNQIEKWIIQAINHNKKVILVSDIYFSLAVIKKIILQKTNIPNIETYISCEYRKSKSKKTLYKTIKENLSIEYKNWLHIGDNIISDVNHAESLGINTIHYSIDKNTREQFLIENGYINDDLGLFNSIRKIAAINNSFEDDEKSFYYSLGSTIIGPLFWFFSSWLNELCIKYKLKQINFLMREGKIFEKYYKKRFDNFDTNLIYASRKSTFLASLDEKDFDISEFNFYNYRKLTIEDFHKLFKIDMCEVLIKYKLVKFEHANQIYFEKSNLTQLCIKNFYSQKDKVTQTILKEKELLKEYLAGINISKNSLLVDFGGTGTISMRITELLKGKIELNALLYMHEIGHYHTLSHKTLPFLYLTNKTKKALEIIRRSPEFIEILLNGIEKTTVSYKKQDEKIVVEQEYPYLEVNDLKENIEAFEKGIDNFFVMADYYKLDGDINIENLTLLLTRIIDVPTEIEVKFLGQLYYDEGKGVSLIEKLVSEEKVSKLKEQGIDRIYKNFQNDLFYKRNEFHWLQGLITSLDSKYILSMKGLSIGNSNNESISSILDILDTNLQIKKVNIYGAGEFFQELLPHLKERNIEVASVIDRKAKLSEFNYEGYNVVSMEKALIDNNIYPIIVTSKVFAVDITDMIFNYGIENNLDLKVINYYDGLVFLNN